MGGRITAYGPGLAMDFTDDEARIITAALTEFAGMDQRLYEEDTDSSTVLTLAAKIMEGRRPGRCQCGCGCDYKLDGYAPGETICGACEDNCFTEDKP